ncbi:Transcriptional regulatory protein sin3, partial [Cladochytrium tenue]
LTKDDPISDDSASTEERWSRYVDHYISMSGTDGVKAKEPFLHRNLPTSAPSYRDEAEGVELSSGLELKICINTYKIFFVENTEDYFCRRGPRRAVALQRSIDGTSAVSTAAGIREAADGSASSTGAVGARPSQLFGHRANEARAAKWRRWLAASTSAASPAPQPSTLALALNTMSAGPATAVSTGSQPRSAATAATTASATLAAPDAAGSSNSADNAPTRDEFSTAAIPSANASAPSGPDLPDGSTTESMVQY